MAYCSSWGKNTHGGDCTLGLFWVAAVGSGPWHRSQVREIKAPSDSKGEGTEGQLATYGGSLGLLPKGLCIWEHLGTAHWVIKVQKHLRDQPLGNASPKKKYSWPLGAHAR